MRKILFSCFTLIAQGSLFLLGASANVIVADEAKAVFGIAGDYAFETGSVMHDRLPDDRRTASLNNWIITEPPWCSRTGRKLPAVWRGKKSRARFLNLA